MALFLATIARFNQFQRFVSARAQEGLQLQFLRFIYVLNNTPKSECENRQFNFI